MDDTGGIRPMRSVSADDYRETPSMSPLRFLARAGEVVAVWIAIFVAEDVLAVPFAVIVGCGVAITAVITVIELVRWRIRQPS